MFFEIRLTYLFLRFLLFISMGLIGYYISKKNKWKWKYTIIPTLIFGLIEGLRYLRGKDYIEYYYRYITINHLNVFDFYEDPLFVILCQTLIKLGIPYQGFILLCSSLLIFSSFFILKELKYLMVFSLPLLAILGMTPAENLIRWFLGFSFIIIGIHFLLRNKWKTYFFYSIIACGFHVGLILVIPIFIGIFYMKNKLIIKPIYACIIYIIIWQTFKVDFMLIFVDIFSTLGNFGRYMTYVNNIEGWLTGDNKQLDLAVPISNVFKHLFLIFYGYKILQKQNEAYKYFYCLFVIGAITYPAMHIIELPNRYNMLFLFFESLVAAGVLYDIFIVKKRINIYTFLALASLYSILVYIFKYPFVEDVKSLLFIWDTNIPSTIKPL